MAWAKPQFKKGQIDRAGEILSLPEDAVLFPEQIDVATSIVNNWRAVHSYPLQAMKMTLKRRAKSICHSAIIAQRLKRLASIKLKLRLSQEAGHHPNLSQMQDIGGCRAIVDSVYQVRALEQKFLEASRKNPHRGPQYHKTYDYITAPQKQWVSWRAFGLSIQNQHRAACLLQRSARRDTTAISSSTLLGYCRGNLFNIHRRGAEVKYWS